MRRLCTGLVALVLMLGLLAVEPLEAKVYKMKPEERTAALKEKKAKRSRAKKAGKPVPGADQGGWVEVKPGEKIAKKNRKSKVDDLAKAAEQKGKKSKKSKKADAEEVVEKPHKKSRNSRKEAVETKAEKKGKKSKEEGSEEIVVEKKGHKSKAEERSEEKSDKKVDKRSEQRTERKLGKKSKHTASRGDRVVGHNFNDEHKVPASSTEVHRAMPERPAPAVVAPAPTPAPAPADDLSSYSVSRPGREKNILAPEVRQNVQPGPLDASRPVSSDLKSGEGRF